MSTIEDELLVTETADSNARNSFGVPGGFVGARGIGISIIDRYLLEQQELSAVERFSHFHDDPVLLARSRRYSTRQPRRPLQSRYYSALLPAAPPRDGRAICV